MPRLEELTMKKIPKSCNVIKAYKRYFSTASEMKYFPLVADRTSGSIVTDKDGNQYIDFLSSACVCNIGYSHPKVIEAVKTQLDKMANFITSYFYSEPCIELAERLVKIAPGNSPKKIALGFSGSDAVDSALKAARAFTKKKYILSFKNSYHGVTYGALAVTDMISPDKKRLVCSSPYVETLDFPGFSESGSAEKTITELERVLEELKFDVAGIIFEPIQGDAGIVIPPDSFFRSLKQVCERYGILTIDEEIQTGMGRSGKWWAIEYFGIEPDILVTGKALGGGMPISGIIGRREIMENVPSPLLSYSHMGHAVNACAASATIDVIREEGLLNRANETGAYIVKKVSELKGKYPVLGDMRQRGLLMGVDVVDPETGRADKDLALKIAWRAWEKGLILITFGFEGNVLRIAPPLNIGLDLVDRAMQILDESIHDATVGLVPDDVVQCIAGW